MCRTDTVRGYCNTTLQGCSDSKGVYQYVHRSIVLLLALLTVVKDETKKGRTCVAEDAGRYVPGAEVETEWPEGRSERRVVLLRVGTGTREGKGRLQAQDGPVRRVKSLANG